MPYGLQCCVWLVGRYQSFKKHTASFFRTDDRSAPKNELLVPPKQWYPPADPNGVTIPKKNNIK